MFSEDANTDEEKNVPLYSRCIVLLWCFSDWVWFLILTLRAEQTLLLPNPEKQEHNSYMICQLIRLL